MRKIPFTVSARTARLIGRENVSTANGALVELIKNCHDADATNVTLFFNILYQELPKQLSRENLALHKKNFSEISDFYQLDKVSSNFKLKDLDDDELKTICSYFQSQNSILLIDNGNGMSEGIVEKHWMTIGTDNKLVAPKSSSGRVISGAKGIGRFALDRLGSHCRMITFEKNVKKTKSGTEWQVSWDDFEHNSLTIDKVTALIGPAKKSSYFSYANEAKKKYRIDDYKYTEEKFLHGTSLEISGLRDWWDSKRIEECIINLETLMPPSFNIRFNVYVTSNLEIPRQGKIKTGESDDYDYRVIATVKDSVVNFKMFRNEFDFESFPENFFDLPEMMSYPYQKSDFEREYLEDDLSFNDLFDSSDVDSNIFERIGDFKFEFNFLKRKFSSTDASKYYYNEFNSSQRETMLETFGGIKIYRDNFRVRPYGEKSSSAFDWLKLGDRAAQSPAAPSHKTGLWRIRPNQIIGSISISRIDNLFFEDKSSREGIQENEYFYAFENMIIAVIEKFEKDRQHIMRALNQFVSKDNNSAEKIKDAEALIKKFKKNGKTSFKPDPKETNVLVDAFQAQKDQIKDLIDENKLLVGFASTGLTVSTFSHELRNIQANLLLKTKNLESSINEYVDEKRINKEDDDDPRVLIKDLENVNRRINTWLKFTLECVKRDKRVLRSVDLHTYLLSLRSVWKETLLRQKVNLVIDEKKSKSLFKKIYQIDFDSIFNNLIINSIYAFENRRDKKIEREISIKMHVNESTKKIIIDYQDSGPGLDPVITNPVKIFEALFTTKKDKNGNKIGTGIGMWIISRIITEYRGTIRVVKPRPGFHLKIELPINHGEGLKDV